MEYEDTETMLPNGRRAPSPETEGATDAVISEVKKEDAVLALFDKPFKEKIMAVISTMKARYGSLTIAGVNDKAGFDAVYKARQHVKSVRLEVTQVHKDEKAEALDYCKRLDAAKRTLLAEIEPVEEALQAKEDKITEEKAFIAAESQRKIDALCKARMDALIAVEAPSAIHSLELPGMAEADFQAHLKIATDAFNAKKEKEAAAAAELARLQKEEAERKEKERAEMEAKAKEQAAEQNKIRMRQAELDLAQEKLREEQRAFEEKKQAEAFAKQRAEELEKAKAEAAENARKEAEAEAKRKADAEAARIEAERKAAELKAAQATEIEKLENFIHEIRGVKIPAIRDPKLQGVLVSFTNQIVAFDKAIQAVK